jgi:thioredoxin-like negative regulator of GroEL
MDVALLAHGLAPQVKEMAISVARYQIERNERAAARALLQQLASDAHDRRNAEVAAKLLAELDSPEAAR